MPLLAFAGCCMAGASAQLCTTQSKLAPVLRDTLEQTALDLATAVKAADAAGVRSGTVTSLAANFTGTEAIVRSLGPMLSGEALQVTQLYVLDATGRAPGAAGSADFTCPLADAAASETDFSINGLPQGRFAFAMVEAKGGPHPWLLAFLLQQEGTAPNGVSAAWKMAGFYPHARTAGGHDGLWYWNEARARVAAKQPWLGWLEYGEADTLLRPAAFISTTHLDALHAEQRSNAPAGLAEGLGPDFPVVIKAADGTEFHITGMSAEATDSDGPLRLVLHVQAQGSTDAAAMQARGNAAAGALLTQHPELRSAFTSVLVLVEPLSGNPEVLTLPMSAVR